MPMDLFTLLVLVSLTVKASSSLACSSVGPQNCSFTGNYRNHPEVLCGWVIKGGMVVYYSPDNKNSTDYVIRLRNNETKGRLESNWICSNTSVDHCLSVRHRTDDIKGDANVTFYLQEDKREEQIQETVSPTTMWKKSTWQVWTYSDFAISIEASRSMEVAGTTVYIDDVWYSLGPCQPTTTDHKRLPTDHDRVKQIIVVVIVVAVSLLCIAVCSLIFVLYKRGRLKCLTRKGNTSIEVPQVRDIPDAAADEIYENKVSLEQPTANSSTEILRTIVVASSRVDDVMSSLDNYATPESFLHIYDDPTAETTEAMHCGAVYSEATPADKATRESPQTGYHTLDFAGPKQALLGGLDPDVTTPMVYNHLNEETYHRIDRAVGKATVLPDSEYSHARGLDTIAVRPDAQF